MDTLRDWQTLEAMVERGDMPWASRIGTAASKPSPRLGML